MSRGFSLVELLIATTLGCLVLVGLSNLAAPLARAHVLALRSQTAQMNAAAALSWAESRIRESTWIGSPPASGGASGKLDGCVNGAPGEGGGFPVPIDPARPVRWYALCSKDGRLYRHEGDGCPPSYSCGVVPDGTFGAGSQGGSATASFERPSPYAAVVNLEIEAASGEVRSKLNSSVSFAAAAGRNQ